MKISLSKVYLSLSFILLFSTSCTSGGPEKVLSSAKPAPVEVSIFIDKSASVSFQSPQVLAKCKETVRAAVSAIRSDEDVLRVYFIHGNTSAASAVYQFRLPALRTRPGASTIESTRQRKAHFMANARRRQKAVDRLFQLLAEPNSSVTSGATDVYGFLEKMSEECRVNSKKLVYLFSDGVQTKHFNMSGVGSKPHAEALARRQVKQIVSNYSISQKHLSNMAVEFILPYSEISTSHNQNLTYFWRELLKSFNISVKFR